MAGAIRPSRRSPRGQTLTASDVRTLYSSSHRGTAPPLILKKEIVMANWIKLGIYAAAGVGTYELLRRYGLLKKAGDWLSEQVPGEYKDQAREYADRAHQWADDASGKVREAVGGAVAAAVEHTGGPQNLTGAGRGKTTTTDEPNGVHVPHTVGRGVVR
jgi:hypothetical protein